MLVRILQGEAKGIVEDHDEVTGQSLIDTGFGEAVTMVEGVPEMVPAPELEEGDEADAQQAADDGAEEASEGAPPQGDDEDEDEKADGGAGEAEADDEEAAEWHEGLTVAELEDIGDQYHIEAKDIEGTGAGGGVVRDDWVRVIDAKLEEDDEAEAEVG